MDVVLPEPLHTSWRHALAALEHGLKMSVAAVDSATGVESSGRRRCGLVPAASSRRQPDLAQYLHRRKPDTIGGIEIYRELHAVLVRPFDRGR